ncbi:helicase-like protein [Streptomyces sp. Ag82_O1-15]|uniref:DISARM system helicase DrmA n=1 Tax=Streptomyces sp. Ag82_O1-15 TaxID=1938855 RepID=UPI000BB0CE39|nr:DISARM system helicase DrmA [Streptomyces sp. Ag82_O1-15]PBC94756.1 helicase-like protein [Streptomyces sp. Ag82_O1-15]
MPAQPAQAAVPHPLDEVPQTFRAGDSYAVRDGLVTYVRRDLMGPWDGETETLSSASSGPRDRYLVGMLGPQPQAVTGDEIALAAAQSADSDSGDEQEGDDGEPQDRLTPQAAGHIWASSMGLSFTVPASVGTLSAHVRWGRYTQSEEVTDRGTTRRVWSREPIEHPVDIDVTSMAGRIVELEREAVVLDVQVRQHVGHAGTEELRVVELTLVNRQQDSREARDAHWLFQTEIDVTAFPDDQAAIFLPVDDPLDLANRGNAPEDSEDRRLRLLYRDSLSHAKGRNVAVHAHVRDGERNAHRLTTTWLPEYDVRATTAPTLEEQDLLRGLELGMDELAALAVPARRNELSAVLAPLADGYGTWLEQQRREAHSLPDDLRESAGVAIEQALEICDRITLGIDRLVADDTALEAFRFANRAMALQRRNTAIAAARAGREDDRGSYQEAYDEVYAKDKEAASWRPFQLAFVLLNLDSLTQPGHAHRGTGREALVDLLFFPTGGGKTEAYLGLAAYTFALRRLQGTLGSGTEARSGEAGVGVLMRYTLRLLTAQQFQRAAALVSACEVLRREEFARDVRWGATPFRIGLWVGTSVSPNWFDEAKEQIADARESASDKHARVLQVLTCPWCGSGLTARSHMEYDEGRRRVLLYCPRAEGEDRCPFSRRESPGEGIPVLTVDEEIYRLAPALLIATVDKFAQLPWNGYAGLLFGRVTELCPRHGYRHDDLDAKTGCGSRHNAKGDLPGVTAQPVNRLRPPDLIIQDELHLISGALGTIVGLFESAVDQLCTWSVTDSHGQRREVGPKIVASTATTKRAADQVLGVFGRKVAVFPPQVLDVGDTFFSRQVELSRENPGRRYLGVCAHGTRLKAAEIRVAEILLLAGQQLFDDYGKPADPYMTLVGYFNATRELAGMRRYMDDDITTRVRSNGSRRGQDTLADRIVSKAGMLSIQELTSRVSSSDIGAALKRLEIGFDPERDTSDRRRAFLREYATAMKEKREPRAAMTPTARQAVDVVLATSMLQVGVDVSRFGLMLVVGQPKNTAEYIQASSRVGRDAKRPGLVVTLYNWSRPRDLAHYEDFEHYHATFYRQVEALSVTPFTRRALDRGVAATYVAALRQASYNTSRNLDAHDVDLDGPLAQEVERRLLERAERVGGERPRQYLSERLDRLKDEWRRKRDENSSALGYRKEKRKTTIVSGLLRRADGTRWTELTVGMSMRETENEINLLLPGGGAFLEESSGGGPDWNFGVSDPDSDADQDTAATVDSDEYGPTTTDAAKKGQR